MVFALHISCQKIVWDLMQNRLHNFLGVVFYSYWGGSEEITGGARDLSWHDICFAFSVPLFAKIFRKISKKGLTDRFLGAILRGCPGAPFRKIFPPSPADFFDFSCFLQKSFFWAPYPPQNKITLLYSWLAQGLHPQAAVILV